jgi:hypothetical protein
MKKIIFLPAQNKILSVSVALLLITFFTASWVPKKVLSSQGSVSITGWYDFSTFPNTTGTFTTSGALNISGSSTMLVGPNQNGARAHCIIVLTPSDGSGTITIHQECVFNTPTPQGRWEVVGGTGAYANLKANGSLSMPMGPNGLMGEAMTGNVY